MSSVQVRIRDGSVGKTHLLGEVPWESIDRIIPTLKYWGLKSYGQFNDGDSLCGTFIVDDDGAYFRVDFE